MDVSGGAVVVDGGFWGGLKFLALLVFGIAGWGIGGGSAEVGEEAVGAVDGDVIVGVSSWFFGVDFRAVVGEEPVVGEALPGGDGVAAGRELRQDVVAGVEGCSGLALVAEVDEELAAGGVFVMAAGPAGDRRLSVRGGDHPAIACARRRDRKSVV